MKSTRQSQPWPVCRPSQPPELQSTPGSTTGFKSLIGSHNASAPYFSSTHALLSLTARSVYPPPSPPLPHDFISIPKENTCFQMRNTSAWPCTHPDLGVCGFLSFLSVWGGPDSSFFSENLRWRHTFSGTLLYLVSIPPPSSSKLLLSRLPPATLKI